MQLWIACENTVKTSLILLVEIYRATFSIFFGGNCRFEPSCSNYANQALQKHELKTAVKLIFIRVCKCHPLGNHGYDPVPDRMEKINVC